MKGVQVNTLKEANHTHTRTPHTHTHHNIYKGRDMTKKLLVKYQDNY